ncbi:tetratricopeptide repeat protein [Bradyrhizobium sp. 155]|uniref:tetratricopeptide repeat protein n=1 Tax=Bradyrhizobium sp. 155 TaxID=2782629 RepID=UPI001FFF3D06|nr:tetratricopeptide repeat protein [Bradyrhizobium sp. 155]UPK12187.1 tetratricopeptide repeat protein [Bradyrhizobium sp. 155]
MSSGGADTQTESDLDAEIAELSAIISRNPKDAKAHRRRGLLKARSRRYDEALQDLERTLKLAPDDSHAYGLRALVWAKKGDRDRALRDFDEAIRLAPDDAMLFRTHRDRVLSEKLGGPVAGGDFNILKNPFVLLGLPPTAKPAGIKEAYEDAIEDEVDDADLLMRAQQTLLTPRLRTEAEVGGFLDVDPASAAQIVSDIRTGKSIGEIRGRLIRLHSLPRSNVIAHYGSARPLELDDLCHLIEVQAAVAPGGVCDAINDVRQEIGLGRVDRDTVAEALSKLLDRQTKAVIEALGFEDRSVAVFDQFVSKVASGADSATIFMLDVYVSMYRQTVASELSKRGEAVVALCEEIRKNPKPDGTYRELEKAIRFWFALLRPVQTYETHRQREDAVTREMYGKVRELALHLSNERCEFESAAKIVAVASRVFGHLPRAADQMADDAKQLVELRNDKLADELLTPLLQACEQANNSHRTVECELLKAGFGSGSVGSIKSIFDKFVEAVNSTAKLPFSDTPWRLVRAIAISLNNESSSPQAADKIIQGLLDYATQRPPTPEMTAVLREDQRAVRKNHVENDLTKNLQAQKWKEVEQLAERLLTLETDEENLKAARTIRDAAAAKRKAGTRVLWFWGIVIVGGAIWAFLANSGSTGPQRSQYQPPPSNSNTTWPQTTSPSQTTTPPPQRNDSFDTGEAIPAVGTGLALTRANIRYCVFQRVRIEAARPLIQAGVPSQRFGSAVDDYNSRCSDYRYRQSDKDAVDGELLGKRYSLESEGRGLAASWRPPSPSGTRGGR